MTFKVSYFLMSYSLFILHVNSSLAAFPIENKDCGSDCVSHCTKVADDPVDLVDCVFDCRNKCEQTMEIPSIPAKVDLEANHYSRDCSRRCYRRCGYGAQSSPCFRRCEIQCRRKGISIPSVPVKSDRDEAKRNGCVLCPWGYGICCD